MALGVRQEGVFTVLSIPLEWDTNTVLANHLRMLADEIEQSGVSIVDVRLSAPVNQPGSKTVLQFVGFPPKDQFG